MPRFPDWSVKLSLQEGDMLYVLSKSYKKFLKSVTSRNVFIKNSGYRKRTLGRLKIPCEQRVTEKNGVWYLPLYPLGEIGSLPFVWINISASVREVENHWSWIFNSFQLQFIDLCCVGKILTYCKSAEIHYADACNSANTILELCKLEKVGNHKVQMLSWCKLIVMQLGFSRLGSLSLSVSGKISHHLPSCSTLYSRLLNTTNLTKKPHLPGRQDYCRAAMYLRSMVDKSGNDLFFLFFFCEFVRQKLEGVRGFFRLPWSKWIILFWISLTTQSVSKML